MLQFFDTLTDDSGNSLLGATVTVTQYPSGAAAAIYSANGTANPIANNTVAADITGQLSFYAPDGAYILTYMYKGTQYKVRSPVQFLDPIGFVAINDTGALNGLVVTDQRLPAQLYPGLKIEIKAAQTNTLACTLNLNATGVQPINQPGGSGLAPGMIQQNGLARLEWDGAQWQLIGSQSQPFYASTTAENNASVDPVNTAYPEGVVNRYGNNTTPGTTDMTLAIQNAFKVQTFGGAATQFLEQTYLVTSIAIQLTVSTPRMTIFGVPLRTIILNKAAANNATIDCSGAQYFDIRGLVLIGATGFSNKGIYMHKDGSANRCGFFNIQDIVCQTNGGGIHIQDTNTGYITNYMYWPSGGSSFGGTIDVNGQPYGILADGTSAVNSIHLKSINCSGINLIVNDATAAAVKIDGTGSGAAFQDWTIQSMDAERSGTRALWGRNCTNLVAMTLFHENAEVRIDNGSNRCTFIGLQGSASGTFVIDSTVSPNRQLTFLGCTAKNLTADAATVEDTYIGCSYQVAPGLADTKLVARINTESTGSVLLGDMMGAAGTVLGGSANAGFISQSAMSSARINVSYGSVMNVFSEMGNSFVISVTDNRAMAVSVVNATDGQRLTITVKNVSGGAIGVFTWNGIKMTAWTNPANTFNRVLDIEYDSTDATWRQIYQSTADIPN